MCSTCERDQGRRWTSARLLVLAFVATLLVLSVAGLLVRLTAASVEATNPCREAASAAVRFQSVVTRDLGRPARLRTDTAGLVSALRSLGATRCPETRRFLASAEGTLRELCPECASELRRVRTSAA